MSKTLYYTEGTAARRLPQNRPDPSDELLLIPGGKKKEKRRRSMSFSTMLVLSMATVMFAYFCYSFLKVEASITAAQSRIAELKTELSKLKTDNDVLAQRLEAQVDLDAVYRIATEELGMVYPDQNEQIVYSSQIREYVRQHENIPGT